ncbi:MAG TPA: hypothetical protein PLQ13_11865, partial [Candidatus Krumholzibacteria bacterium]|nr:hypothetical protein [Candidatus Krumholzibacteria bacterium]
MLVVASIWTAPPGARSAAAGYPPLTDGFAALDADGNGVEDALDAWRRGDLDWSALRGVAVAAAARAPQAAEAPAAIPDDLKHAPGPWARGQVRVLWFDAPAGVVAASAAASAGVSVLHRVDAFALDVLACDEAGLAALLARAGEGRLQLDRDGVPALDVARPLVGADRVRQPGWNLGRDWSATVAILDSGCDTAHGDLGDASNDNADGPAPFVGDADDWYPADLGWPLFEGYKVVGWADVTDDFPEAQGPWDYHWHGTALASVVAGSGAVDARYAGLAPA